MANLYDDDRLDLQFIIATPCNYSNGRVKMKSNSSAQGSLNTSNIAFSNITHVQLRKSLETSSVAINYLYEAYIETGNWWEWNLNEELRTCKTHGPWLTVYSNMSAIYRAILHDHGFYFDFFFKSFSDMPWCRQTSMFIIIIHEFHGHENFRKLILLIKPHAFIYYKKLKV